MGEVSVVIPVGPAHVNIVQRAIASVEDQTESAEAIVIYDKNGRGPGWARNQGVSLVKTEYVVFLDADDELMPDFVERTLKAVEKNHYVYTGWYEPNEDGIATIKDAPDPCEVWRFNQSFHLVTALVPAEWTRRIEFDETMIKGGEDRAFWYELTRAGCCPKRINKPLVAYHYTGDDSRSHQLFFDRREREKLYNDLFTKYGGLEMACSSCGGTKAKAQTSQLGVIAVRDGNHTRPNEFVFDRGDGFVEMKIDTLVECLRPGRRTIMGRSTGYTYPRCGKGDRLWIDFRDAQSMPNAFKIVPLPDGKSVLKSVPDEPGKKRQKKQPASREPHNSLAVLANAVTPGGTRQQLIPAPARKADVKPEFNRVIRIMQEALS